MLIGITKGVFKNQAAFAFCVLAGCVLLLMGSPAAAYDEHVPDSGQNLVCALCHSCDFPTHGDLCLKNTFCMRSESQAKMPDRAIMVLDEMEKVYDPVYFSHDKHAQMSQMSGGCENCHHFVPPSTGHPACKECHTPESQRGKIEPGLKAAYHQQCLNCHSEWDTETHCEFCHRKKEGGMTTREFAQLPHRLHSPPLQVNDLIIFETNYEGGGLVPFHHLNHVEKYDRDCSVCHVNESCSSCHVHGAESHPLGLLSDIDLHDTCYQCHDKEKGCNECHGRNSQDLFDHAVTGWALEPYHLVLQCKECHHDAGKYMANDPRCETCHFDGWDEQHFNHGVTGVVLDPVHLELDCSDCHEDGVGQTAQCGACHDDDRVWVRHGSFGPGID